MRNVADFYEACQQPNPLFRVRLFVNFLGTHSEWAITGAGYLAVEHIAVVGAPGQVKYYGTVSDLTGTYRINIYSDTARTVLVMQSAVLTNGTHQEVDCLEVGSSGLTATISQTDFSGGGSLNFEIERNQWVTDDQSPSATHWPDVAEYFRGQVRITDNENDSIFKKAVTRKISFALENNDNMFYFKYFNDVYDPTVEKFNGPYDVKIYNKTGGGTYGVKLGNLRSGRFMVLQIGVFNVDPLVDSWVYIDKFRGYISAIECGEGDQNVQFLVEDERFILGQVKTVGDTYIGKTFEYIFQHQCENRLGFAAGDIVVPTTDYVMNFVYMPDAGATVLAALETLAEAVGGSVDVDETGKIICSSRLYEGDDPYTFGVVPATDTARTFTDDDFDDIQDVLSSSVVFNEKIVNSISIKSNPVEIEQSATKVWRLKYNYNKTTGKNETYLKAGRFFGDVWANNMTDKEQVPIKAIDRGTAFNPLAEYTSNATYLLRIVNVPGAGGVGTVDAQLKRQSDGTIYPLAAAYATVYADGSTETELSSIDAPNTNYLDDIFITLNNMVAADAGSEAQIQLGVHYYADFGSDFRVLQNNGIADPEDSRMYFNIISSVYDPAGDDNYTDEKTASSFDALGNPNNNHSDRIVMALEAGYSDYDTENVFFIDSLNDEAVERVKVLLYNRDSVARWVNTAEIFGRRIVQNKAIEVNVQASTLIMQAFGGEQRLEINNNYIMNNEHGQLIGKFVVDNYGVPRDAPKMVVSHQDKARPFLQVRDRIKVIDAYTTRNKEYVIKEIDQTYSNDQMRFEYVLREADRGLPYDAGSSASSLTTEAREQLVTLAGSVDVGPGESAEDWTVTTDVNGYVVGIRPNKYIVATSWQSDTLGLPVPDDSHFVFNRANGRMSVYDASSSIPNLVARFGLIEKLVKDAIGTQIDDGEIGAWLMNLYAMKADGTPQFLPEGLTLDGLSDTAKASIFTVKSTATLTGLTTFPTSVAHGVTGIPVVKAMIRGKDTAGGTYSKWHDMSMSTHAASGGSGNPFYETNAGIFVDDTNITFYMRVSEIVDNTHQYSVEMAAAYKTWCYMYDNSVPPVLTNIWDEWEIIYWITTVKI